MNSVTRNDLNVDSGEDFSVLGPTEAPIYRLYVAPNLSPTSAWEDDPRIRPRFELSDEVLPRLPASNESDTEEVLP